MDSGQDNWDKEWAGLEPKLNNGGSRGCWMGLIALSFVLLAICVAVVYLAWQRLDPLLQAEPLLTPPTVVSGAEDKIDGTQLPASGTPTFAPTVTLAAANANRDITAGQLSFVPVLDGDFQEWGAVPSYESPYRVYNVADWDGTDDLLAHWFLGWDATALYVFVTIEDERHVQTQTGNQIFKGDSVSLQIDTRRDADFGPTLSSDDFQINLSPGDFAGIPPSAFRFRGTSSGRSSDAPGDNIKVAAQSIGQGYTLEAAIPWQDLDISPTTGMVIGLALNANDNDTPGTAVQEVMKSHVATRTFGDPTSWGTLTLR